MSHKHTVLGWHWTMDFSFCQALPNTVDKLEETMLAGAKISNATVVAKTFHAFSPFGLSGVIVIAESHLAVHTWPEHQAACIDLFSCTKNLNVDDLANYLKVCFGAQDVCISCKERSVQTS